MDGSDARLYDEMIGQGFLGKKVRESLQRVQRTRKTVHAHAMNLVKKLQKKDLKLSDEDTVSRLSSRFVNEVVLSVQDHMIASPTEGDSGSVFGIGFFCLLLVDRSAMSTKLAALSLQR
ncbi:hypothetical protein PsorP6_018429 [Peronosclerospora sorghi]|nr:hypothetical protein PsorP6_018435 [Peronosclerospora sorghi]KAI9895529.1 hypothetical protein PsorP6_018429 [Peronosclerospora sorghi]